MSPRTNEKLKARFFIVNESMTPLFGLNATEKMKLLNFHKEHFVNVVESSDLIDKYSDVFNRSRGTLPGKLHLQVDPDTKSVVLSARKIPVSVPRLESTKVIAPVDQRTEWVSQVVVAVK